MVQDNQPPLIIQVLIGRSVGFGKEILLGISMHSNMVNMWHFEELYLPNHLLCQNIWHSWQRAERFTSSPTYSSTVVWGFLGRVWALASVMSLSLCFWFAFHLCLTLPHTFLLACWPFANPAWCDIKILYPFKNWIALFLTCKNAVLHLRSSFPKTGNFFSYILSCNHIFLCYTLKYKTHTDIFWSTTF